MSRLFALLLMAWPTAVFAEGKTTVFAAGENLREPFGMVWLPDGRMAVVEYKGNRVQAISPDGTITTLAGSGKKALVDGPADKAAFNAPHNLASAPDGTLYVADTFNHTVRRIDPKTCEVTTIAGTGRKGYTGDGGPAIKATFNQTYHVALDAKAENLLVCDLGNAVIRNIDLKTGTVTTIIGTGKRGVPKDGSEASKAPLQDPRAVEIDKEGRVWILERGGHCLRVVEKGRIRTVMGTGKKGFSDGGGEASKVMMNGPKYLYIDPEGDILIADTENHCIMKLFVRTGKAARLAGIGKKGSGGIGGTPEMLQLNRPHAVLLGKDGLYIADSDNNRIIRIGESTKK